MTTLRSPGAESGYLARVADTVAAIEGKLDRLLDRQESLIVAIASMSEQLGTQSEMLAEILGAAQAEPEESPVAELLAQLAAAVNDNTRAVATMFEELGSIPDEIGEAVAAAIAREKPPES